MKTDAISEVHKIAEAIEHLRTSQSLSGSNRGHHTKRPKSYAKKPEWSLSPYFRLGHGSMSALACYQQFKLGVREPRT